MAEIAAPRRLLPALALTSALAASSVHAAGGHHAIDDASILEPGQCELEGWGTRAQDGAQLVRAGAACRVGPVELGLASEAARIDGSSQVRHGVQAKWAFDLLPGLAAGLSAAPVWQTRASPSYQGVTAAVLVTWTMRDDIALHLNIGRDFVHGDADQARSGGSVEWTVRPGWSLVGERYYEDRTHFARAGLRWAASDAWTVDLGRAVRLAGPGQSSWTLGATWQFSGLR